MPRVFPSAGDFGSRRHRNHPARRMALGFVLLACTVPPALANNVGENTSWQFQTSTDKVNQVLSTIVVDTWGTSQDLVLAPFLPGGINPGVGKLLKHFTPSVG